jgi:Ca2+-transporting ATPase
MANNAPSIEVAPEQAACWHSLNGDRVVAIFTSNGNTGLMPEQVTKRRAQYGLNELKDLGGRNSWIIFLDQFKNIMLIMLIAVAIISGVLDALDFQDMVETGDIPFKDTIAILAIVILNGVLGYVQENKAEKALAALKNMASPRVRVVRNGRTSEVGAKELVPGDVMLLEAGVQVAADGRLLEAVNLQVREAALTGEAHAVMKQADLLLPEDTPVCDRLNLVFQGTEVVQGRATVLVTNTGMQTELGKIATMLQTVESEPTPLQRRMDQLSHVLVSGSLTLVGLVVVGGLILSGWGNLRHLLEVSLSMAVAVVPEGLPAVITVTLALGTQRMVRRHALIRKLPAVETLGSVTHICSDKTGTLTQNKMVVQAIHPISGSIHVTGHGYEPEGTFYLEGDRETNHNNHSPVFNAELHSPTHRQTVDRQASAHSALPLAPHSSLLPQQDIPLMHRTDLHLLLLAGTLCNDAALQREKGEWTILGDPTEGALLVVAGKAALQKDQCAFCFPRVLEFPFTSERKRMSVIVNKQKDDSSPNGQQHIERLPSILHSASFILFCKGSPELILERCQSIQVNDRIARLTPELCDRVMQQNNHLASRGLRVLGFAYKPLNSLPADRVGEETEKDMIWLGLVDMLDAPRPEVREAVARCRTAGIYPVMITGDHQLTAQAIADDLGISSPETEILSGRELEKLSEAELEQHIDRVGVYARVAPEHKLRIVQALQHQGKVVAMTGDGVNDAPALKQADIGIAMGITGTDVSKEASDMVLLDDNFATIVAAVEEGRVVYTNIRRFIKYILGSNIGEVLTVAASPILLATGGVPLTPLQILWMNLVTDGLPALALAVEPAEPNVMNRPPYNPRESIFARGLGFYMIRIGIVLSIIAISVMLWGYHYSATTYGIGDNRWKTMVFTTLCLAQMGHAMAIRSNTRLTIELNPFSNPFLLGAVSLTIALQLLLIYLPPLRSFFGTQYLTFTELLVCIGFSMLMFTWVEGEKLFARLFLKGRRE